MSLASGHQYHLLEGEELVKHQKDFLGYKKGLVRLEPGRWLFPSPYLKYADKLFNFKFKPSDVVQMSWEKCGTTWTLEILWTMLNNPNLDNPMSKTPNSERCVIMEYDMIHDLNDPTDLSPERLKIFSEKCPGRDPKDAPFMTSAECLPQPRVIKTHLPFSLSNPSLLDTAKVVAVFRNPKDVVVSYMHHSRVLTTHGYVGSFEDFVQYFVDDDLMYGPYWLHVKEVWEKRGHQNLHIMFYEDMKKDIVAELRKLDKFLGTNLTDEQILNVARHTSFKEMRARAANEPDYGLMPHFNQEVQMKDGGLFRKGESGDWKTKLSPEMEAKVNQWIKEKMDKTGVTFKYEI